MLTTKIKYDVPLRVVSLHFMPIFSHFFGCCCCCFFFVISVPFFDCYCTIIFFSCGTFTICCNGTCCSLRPGSTGAILCVFVTAGYLREPFVFDSVRLPSHYLYNWRLLLNWLNNKTNASNRFLHVFFVVVAVIAFVAVSLLGILRSGVDSSECIVKRCIWMLSLHGFIEAAVLWLIHQCYMDWRCTKAMWHMFGFWNQKL